MAPQPIQRTYKGTSDISRYETDQKLGEGTFGVVYKARDSHTRDVVALKKILMHNEKDGFPITSLREIKLLKALSHENVVELLEMAVEREKDDLKKRATLYMVFPYMEHDLSGLLDNKDIRLSVPIIKCYMIQLLKGLRYLHDSQILHRDMKAANLLISNRGILKIADFGLARHYFDQPPQQGRGNGVARRDYTMLVVTRWYRPPELLLQLKNYTPAIDVWGAGCVFGEMFKRKPILSGKSDVNQAEIIFELVGSPNEQNMPGWKDLPGCEGVKQWDKRPGNIRTVFRDIGDDALSLLQDLLTLNYLTRINAVDALDHPYFKNDPLPFRPEQIPRFVDSHELDRRGDRRNGHQELPPAPPGGTVGGAPTEWGVGSRQPSRYPAHGDSRYPPPPPPAGAYDPRYPAESRYLAETRDARYPGAGPVGGRRAPLPQPPDGMRHALPARPDGLPSRPDWDAPPPMGGGGGGGAGRRHGGHGGHGGHNVDTYVPNYGGGAGGPRRTRSRSPDRERERDRRRDRDRDRDVYRR